MTFFNEKQNSGRAPTLTCKLREQNFEADFVAQKITISQKLEEQLLVIQSCEVFNENNTFLNSYPAAIFVCFPTSWVFQRRGHTKPRRVWAYLPQENRFIG